MKCMKLFINYPKYYSETAMVLELGPPSFDLILLLLHLITIYFELIYTSLVGQLGSGIQLSVCN